MGRVWVASGLASRAHAERPWREAPTTATPENCADPVTRVRALLTHAATILVDELADEPGGWTRAQLLPDIDRMSDIAVADDPRRLVAEASRQQLG
jgi:hypothetical protein